MTVISQKHVAKFLTNLITDYRVFMGLKVKLYIALRVHTSECSELYETSLATCHPTQVNAPRLSPARKAGTRLIYPGGMEG